MIESAGLKITALNATHRASGGKMVDFGGWDMPLQYSGILDEHRAVRSSVGLFDVSHMGEIEVRGPEACALTDFVTTNAVAKLAVGQAQYSGLLYEHGGFVDDILVHKIADDHYFLCVNASNQEKDYQHIAGGNQFDCSVELASDRYSQFAIQGPRAEATLQKLTSRNLAAIAYYHFIDGMVAGVSARIARTGYTGEDGFEIYIPPSESEGVWNALLEAGEEFGIKPCGLGARNTTPLEAGLAWIVKLDKGEFTGRATLVRQKESGITRKLAGFEITGRGIGRDGYEVFIDGEPAGWVTSGGPSPTLAKNLGMCYLPADRAKPGQRVQIVVRGQPVDAVTIPLPFYKRAK